MDERAWNVTPWRCWVLQGIGIAKETLSTVRVRGCDQALETDRVGVGGQPTKKKACGMHLHTLWEGSLQLCR